MSYDRYGNWVSSRPPDKPRVPIALIPFSEGLIEIGEQEQFGIRVTSPGEHEGRRIRIKSFVTDYKGKLGYDDKVRFKVDRIDQEDMAILTEKI